MLRLFISSVQKEFAGERAALRDYLRGDALLRRFFEPFLFEDMPAADRRADEVYLDEVGRCDVYLGLFGDDYGFEDADGVSPTHREFNHATQLHKQRLIFVKGADDSGKHPKMRALIGQAGTELIRRRFTTVPELVAGLYASLVRYLVERELIREAPTPHLAARRPWPIWIRNAWRGFFAKPGTPVVFRCPKMPNPLNCSCI